MITIIILALVGAVLAAVIGTLWYSMGTPMGKIHMRALGFDKLSPEEQKQKIEEAKLKMPKVYGAQLLLSFLTSFATVFIVQMSIQNGTPVAMALAFPVFNWLCFMVPITGSAHLWGNIDPAITWKKFFSDIFANLVTVLVIGILAVFFV